MVSKDMRGTLPAGDASSERNDERSFRPASRTYDAAYLRRGFKGLPLHIELDSEPATNRAAQVEALLQFFQEGGRRSVESGRRP